MIWNKIPGKIQCDNFWIHKKTFAILKMQILWKSIHEWMKVHKYTIKSWNSKECNTLVCSSIFILSDKLWFLYHHDSASLYMSSQSKHCDFHFLSHVLLTKWLSSIINVCPQLQTFSTFFLLPMYLLFCMTVCKIVEFSNKFVST